MRKPLLPFAVYRPPLPIIAPQKPAYRPPETSLPRIVQYPADQGGCAAWRMTWPGHLLNAHQKASVQESTVMVTTPQWYNGVKAVRLQRQATPPQKEFVKFLKSIQKDYGFRLIYEIDDIVFREDIPDYNKFKAAFESDEIRQCSEEIMKMCDEITVTNAFMRDYYREKLGKQEITIIPNFPPRWWIGNFYDPSKVKVRYDKHRKRPRILYAGSAAHYDLDKRNKGVDDFSHVIEHVIKTRHKYKWVFIGGVHPDLQQYVQNGDIEFHGWCKTYDYGKTINDLEINMFVAPLVDNTFNRAKSDIKFIEACAFGVPIACQDLCTYEQAPIKFTTGEEMIDQIDRTLRNAKQYKADIPRWREYAEDRFLEHDRNIDCFMEVFLYPYGDPRRRNLERYNKSI